MVVVANDGVELHKRIWVKSRSTSNRRKWEKGDMRFLHCQLLFLASVVGFALVINIPDLFPRGDWYNTNIMKCSLFK